MQANIKQGRYDFRSSEARALILFATVIDLMKADQRECEQFLSVQSSVQTISTVIYKNHELFI